MGNVGNELEVCGHWASLPFIDLRVPGHTASLVGLGGPNMVFTYFHFMNSERDRGDDSLYEILLIQCLVGKPWITSPRSHRVLSLGREGTSSEWSQE